MTAPCCANCSQTQLRDRTNTQRDELLRDHGRNGWLVCNLSEYRASFHYKTHCCDRHQSASPEVVQARHNWLKAHATTTEAAAG